MSFMPPMPDPEEVLKSIERLRDAFQAAADRSNGEAKELFQDITDTFKEAVDKATTMGDAPDISTAMRALMPMMAKMKTSATKLQKLAQTDPDVVDTMLELEGTLRKEMQSLMKGVGGGVLSKQFPKMPKGPTKLPPRKPKPRKPNNGDFDI